MAKSIPTVHKKKRIDKFVKQGLNDETENEWSNKSYKDKKYKGRSISMSDDFYNIFKGFVEKHPELGGISQTTVRALHEFMANYTNKA